MKVSLVMAVYNGEKYLIEQLDSIRKQTYLIDEVILIDDVSIDNSYELIHQYIDGYKLINWKLIKNENNLGYRKNFKKGLKIVDGDIIFLSVIFICLAGFAAGFYLTHQNTGASVEVTVDGKVYGTYPLDEDDEIPIRKDGKTTNLLVIKDGKADVTEADCPDKLCVHQKAISKTNETIVCLPNKVVVQVIGAGESELDSIAR